ncbi:follistatin isoform X2 [Anabrus simplex]|uniref:follistatin isoform X2 n=1 Tax=Anabrus simplex TaxID=316456 RepID=UPI0034DD8E4E
MDPGTLFFWRVLGGGVPCYACKESCTGVQCGEGRKCVVRRGQPKCVCSPDCRKNRHKGPVCGSDGRTYRTVCRLRKRACRRKSSTLSVAYDGHCQKAATCGSVQCRERQSCLIEPHSGAPRCVTCSYRCPKAVARRDMGGPICGTNNLTYDSWCHMLKDACDTGYVIETKFSGHCETGVPKPTVANTVLDGAANTNRYVSVHHSG